MLLDCQTALAPPRSLGQTIFYSSYLETPLGQMFAIANESTLYLLEFEDRYNLEQKIQRLCSTQQAHIKPGRPSPIQQLESELHAYFKGDLTTFKTPLYLSGTSFQQQVWKVLMNIPYGQTRSYADQAKALGREKSFRAVANANAANSLAIIIPCHRVITSGGALGGYAGGITRKAWLIQHEKQYSSR